MKCHFLQEARVKYCGKSPVRKMIVQQPGSGGDETCSTPAFRQCGLIGSEIEPGVEACPHLHQTLVQYCSVDTSVKYIPYSEALLARCMTERYRYCRIFLDWATSCSGLSALPPQAARRPDSTLNEYAVENIATPGWLEYTPNHLWIDSNSESFHYIGLDAFLARLLGPVDKVSFPTNPGVTRPAVVLTIDGVDLQLVFPHTVHVESCNLHLRSTPERLTADPYRVGWLFEIQAPADRQDEGPAEQLVTGEQAAAWMREEIGRVSEHCYESLARECADLGATSGDGGAFCEHLARRLNNDQLLTLFNSMCSPYRHFGRFL